MSKVKIDGKFFEVSDLSADIRKLLASVDKLNAEQYRIAKEIEKIEDLYAVLETQLERRLLAKKAGLL